VGGPQRGPARAGGAARLRRAERTCSGTLHSGTDDSGAREPDPERTCSD